MTEWLFRMTNLINNGLVFFFLVIVGYEEWRSTGREVRGLLDKGRRQSNGSVFLVNVSQNQELYIKIKYKKIEEL